MSDASATPTFEACETKRGADWSVLVKWPDEREQYLDGFQSRDHSVDWINDKSLAWFEAQQIHPCPSGPRCQDHLWSRFEIFSLPTKAGGPTVTGGPGQRDVGAIDELISVIDSHRDAMKEHRIARGETYRDEQGSE